MPEWLYGDRDRDSRVTAVERAGRSERDCRLELGIKENVFVYYREQTAANIRTFIPCRQRYLLTPTTHHQEASKIRAAVSLVYPMGGIEFDRAGVGIEKLCSDEIFLRWRQMIRRTGSTSRIACRLLTFTKLTVLGALQQRRVPLRVWKMFCL